MYVHKYMHVYMYVYAYVYEGVRCIWVVALARWNLHMYIHVFYILVLFTFCIKRYVLVHCPGLFTSHHVVCSRHVINSTTGAAQLTIVFHSLIKFWWDTTLYLCPLIKVNGHVADRSNRYSYFMALLGQVSYPGSVWLCISDLSMYCFFFIYTAKPKSPKQDITYSIYMHTYLQTSDIQIK